MVPNFLKKNPKFMIVGLMVDFLFLTEIYLSFLVKKMKCLKETSRKTIKKKQIIGFKHLGFWQCMDTPRDKEYLIELIKKKKAP